MNEKFVRLPSLSEPEAALGCDEAATEDSKPSPV
jgi:hypothetical protein